MKLFPNHYIHFIYTLLYFDIVFLKCNALPNPCIKALQTALMN